jgi:FkbM family methyltransferase
METIYFSQFKQDQILNEIIFNHRKNGTFLDIGANDGITYSNTYFFEKNLDWRGLCIEPLAPTFKKLESNRNCILENCAAGSTNRVETFLAVTGYAEMLSGLKKNYDKRHLKRINSEIKAFGGEKREIELKVIDINDVLKSTLFTRSTIVISIPREVNLKF